MTRKSLWKRCFIQPCPLFDPVLTRGLQERRYVAELLPVNNNVGDCSRSGMETANLRQLSDCLIVKKEYCCGARRGTDDAKCPDSPPDRLCASSCLAIDAHRPAALRDRGGGILFRDHHRLLRWLHSAQLQFRDGDREVPRPHGR